MTAFLKIDECGRCHRSLPWEWVPAVIANGKTLAGTGVWRSVLTDGSCPACASALEAERQKQRHALAIRSELIRLLGGEKPYREFTFERYRVTEGNRLAYERAKNFNPATDNLYLWGCCGIGKTHLAYAAARHAFEETLAVAILRAAQISRRVRMKEPALEQAAIDEWAGSDVLVLDDVGTGSDTAFSRQLLQEILDARDFSDRAGLVVTSKYSWDDLAARLADDSIPSRLAGMCQSIEITGVDCRIGRGRRAESPPGEASPKN